MSQNLRGDQRGAANTWLLAVIVVLLVVIIGGGAYFFMTKNKEKAGTSTTNTTTTNKSTKENDEDKEESKNENTNKEDEATVSDKSTASMTNVKDGQGTGTATQYKVDGRYTLEITTKSLPEPDEDMIYFAWLEKKVPFSRIEVGELEEGDEDGVYEIAFDADSDYTTYRTVYVTLEPADEEDRSADDSTGEKVLEGRFPL